MEPNLLQRVRSVLALQSCNEVKQRDFLDQRTILLTVQHSAGTEPGDSLI
jgi:hypothetical protein